MESVFGIFKEPLGNQEISSLSFTDKINSKYTVTLLIGFSVLVTAKHYMGDMVSCYCPPEFTDSMVDYANTVCWTTDTYYLPFEKERIPKDKLEKEHGRISYYQWVTLIFLLQGSLFYIPRPAWRFLNKKSGIAVNTITESAVNYQLATSYDEKEKIMRYMIGHLKRYLDRLRKNYTKSCGIRRILKSNGNYLLVTYLFVKSMYIINIIIQMSLLNSFLGMDYGMYGFKVLENIFHGQSWRTSDRFPRVTLCDFKIRTMGNMQAYTIQCSLPVNLLNEFLFIILWFWMAIVGITTVCSFLLWCWSSLYIPGQKKRIKRFLIAQGKIDSQDNNAKKEVDQFVDEYLRKDGFFIMKMVSVNTNVVISARLIGGIWERYKENC